MGNSCSFGLRYVSWYKYLIVSLVFSHLGFWSGNLFLIAPFPDLCLLVPFHYAFKLCLSQKGPGRWKMNIRIFNDNIYVKNIKTLLIQTKNDYNHISEQLIWKLCKIIIKEYTIEYCKQEQKIKINVMKN